jgi:hypothetical protein
MKPRTHSAIVELVEAIEEEYSGMSRDALNQVYMWGPFAGWSGHDLVYFAENRRKDIERTRNANIHV